MFPIDFLRGSLDIRYMVRIRTLNKEEDMKLLTQELKRAFEKQGDTRELEAADTKIIAKFFNPQGAGTWYAVEYDPETGLFFGFVSIFGDYNDELGSFSLAELESFRGKLGLPIERDLYLGQYNLQEILDGKRP